MYSAIVYYNILHYTVLYNNVQCYSVLQCTVPYCIIKKITNCPIIQENTLKLYCLLKY